MSAFQFTLTVAALALALSACDSPTDGEPAFVPAATAGDAGARTSPANPADYASPAMNANDPKAAECGADKLGRWLNVPLTEAVKADIREAVGQKSIRYIAPGDEVTLDFSLGRLNVETGTDGRIKLFRCG